MVSYFSTSPLTCRNRSGVLSCGRDSCSRKPSLKENKAEHQFRFRPYEHPNLWMFTQQLRTWSFRGIFIETLDKEISQGLRTFVWNRRHVVFDDAEHHCGAGAIKLLSIKAKVNAPHMLLGISAYGGRPVSSSIIVQANDHMSDLVEAPLSSITSGAIQLGVPTTFLTSYFMARRLRETPKSESLTFPVFVVRMLAAFRSQCTTLFVWR